MSWKRSVLDNNYKIQILKLEVEELLANNYNEYLPVQKEYLDKVNTNKLAIARLQIDRLKIENNYIIQKYTIEIATEQ